MCAAWERRAPWRDRYSITAQKPALCCQNKFCFGWLLPGAQIKLLSTSVKYPWVLNIHEWRRIKTVASGSMNPAWILRQIWLSYSWLLSLFPSEKHNYIPSFPPMHFKSPCMADSWLAGAPRVQPCCTSREAGKCPEQSRRTWFIWVWTQVRLQMRNTEEGISSRTRPQNAEAGECDSRSAVVSSSSAPLIDWVCKKHLAHRKQEGDWGNHQVVPMNYSHFAKRLPHLPAYIRAVIERHCQAADTLWIKRDLREKAKCMCGTLSDKHLLFFVHCRNRVSLKHLIKKH